MRDIVHNVGLAEAIAPATYAADTTPVAVDLLGFDSAMVSIHVGVGGISFTDSNKIEFVMTHSDDDENYSTVTDDDIQGVTGTSNGIVYALTTAHAASSFTKVGYVGGLRYLKLLADFSGTHATGTGIDATVVKGRAHSLPVA